MTTLATSEEPSPPPVDIDVPVRLHPLTFLPEGDEVTVGRLDTDSYCVLPADGSALLQQLADGRTPRQASDWYQQQYGEPVDMAEFLAALEELDFIASEPAAADRVVRWQRLGRALFAPPAWVVFGLLIVGAAAAMIRHHDLVPETHQMYFCRYATVVLLVAVFGQFPFVLLHEAFHALAGRRLGLGSRLRISRRLNVLVAETSLDGLVVVPRRQRYLPILSGMLADLLVVSALTLIAFATRQPDGNQPLVGSLCLALAFTTLLRLLWQFYFFLQTDLYQLIVAVLGCIDLHRTAARLIVNRAGRLIGRAPRYDESSWHPRDRRAARWYAWVLLSGYVISLGSFVLAVLPLLVHLFRGVFQGLFGQGSLHLDSVADSAVFLLLTAAQLTVVAVLFVRERRQRTTSSHLIG